jgi:hypothetical protein
LINAKVREQSPQNAALHSVHPIPDKDRLRHGGGSLRVFKQFAWLEVGSVKVALSRPTHQYP